MTTLKDYILHQLREIKREMLAAIEGLAEDDLAWLAAEDQGPIAWIVQHCCANVDFFIHKGITGQFCLEHEPRFLLWPLPPRRPDDAYPPRSELAERWSRLLDAGAAALESAGAERLQEPSASSRPPEPLVESCLRVVNHTNAHLRQLWCILGQRRVAGKWPVQETWLA